VVLLLTPKHRLTQSCPLHSRKLTRLARIPLFTITIGLRMEEGNSRQRRGNLQSSQRTWSGWKRRRRRRRRDWEITFNRFWEWNYFYKPRLEHGVLYSPFVPHCMVLELHNWFYNFVSEVNLRHKADLFFSLFLFLFPSSHFTFPHSLIWDKYATLNRRAASLCYIIR